MRSAVLAALAAFTFIMVPTLAELAPLDQKEVESFMQQSDGAGLVRALHGKTISLSGLDMTRARQVLVRYAESLGEGDAVERRRLAEVVTAIALAEIGLGSDASKTPVEDAAPSAAVTVAAPEAETSPAPAVLPGSLARAVAVKDAPMAIKLIRAKGFDPATAAPGKDDLVALIEGYARPIPAADAKANREAYEALALLAPEVGLYAQKAGTYAAQEKAAREGVLKKLKKTTDQFNGTVFYQSSAQPRYADIRSYLLPYIVERNGAVALRVQLHYTSDSWLFVSGARLNIDGREVAFPAYGDDWKRDHDSEIWEWADVVVDAPLHNLLEDVAASKKTIVRFNGQQYYGDYVVLEKDKQAIRDIFLAVDVLKER